jgi:hypothetical protein
MAMRSAAGSRAERFPDPHRVDPSFLKYRFNAGVERLATGMR